VQKRVLNIPRLMEIFEEVLDSGNGDKVVKEIILQSKVEFHVEAEEQDVLAFEKAEADTEDLV